jgi:hypothetical protein
VNSFALVGFFRDPTRRGEYAGIGPVIFMPHAETQIDGATSGWGYAYAGSGIEALAGVGFPTPFADVKYIAGRIRVGVADGTAAMTLSTFAISAAP